MAATGAGSAGGRRTCDPEGPSRSSPLRALTPMKQIVLVGAGHTHAYVLSRWRRSPISGAQLTCVSPYRFATYSGMLPGMLAGQFERVAMEIDLAVLCASAGVRLIVAEASGLDVGGQRVLLDGAVPEQYDVVSVGVGSVPSLDGVRIDAPSAFVPVKPIQTFIARLTAAVTIHGPAGTRPLNGWRSWAAARPAWNWLSACRVSSHEPAPGSTHDACSSPVPVCSTTAPRAPSPTPLARSNGEAS